MQVVLRYDLTVVDVENALIVGLFVYDCSAVE